MRKTYNSIHWLSGGILTKINKLTHNQVSFTRMSKKSILMFRITKKKQLYNNIITNMQSQPTCSTDTRTVVGIALYLDMSQVYHTYLTLA